MNFKYSAMWRVSTLGWNMEVFEAMLEYDLVWFKDSKVSDIDLNSQNKAWLDGRSLSFHLS